MGFIRLPFIACAREDRPAWFVSPLRVETLREDAAGRLRYKLLEPLRVQSAMDGISLIVPMDFVTDFASARRSDTQRYAAFFRRMLSRGVFLPPSQFEAVFVSLAHTDAEIAETIEAARESLAGIR